MSTGGHGDQTDSKPVGAGSIPARCAKRRYYEKDIPYYNDCVLC